MCPGKVNSRCPVERSTPTREVARSDLRLHERLLVPSVRPGAQVTLKQERHDIEKGK